jgi:hypothetical protein
MSKPSEHLRRRRTWVDALAFIICSTLSFGISEIFGGGIGLKTIILAILLIFFWLFLRKRFVQ